MTFWLYGPGRRLVWASMSHTHVLPAHGLLELNLFAAGKISCGERRKLPIGGALGG